MFDKIFVKTYSAPEMDEREILRYAGCKDSGEESVTALLHSCLAEGKDAFSYRVCYRVFERETLLSHCPHEEVEKRLENCRYVAVFAATVGLGIDRLIGRYLETAPARALMFQAMGAERIEALCDRFCMELKEGANSKGCDCLPRFSPGYGTFPLEAQKSIVLLLDCARQIGLTLNDSLLMTPTKSVTAIIGILERK
jgi:hypothetical protein